MSFHHADTGKGPSLRPSTRDLQILYGRKEQGNPHKIRVLSGLWYGTCSSHLLAFSHPLTVVSPAEPTKHRPAGRQRSGGRFWTAERRNTPHLEPKRHMKEHEVVFLTSNRMSAFILLHGPKSLMPKPIIPKRLPSAGGVKQTAPDQSPESQIQLIQSLMVDVSKLPHRNDAELDRLQRRTKMILTKIFGSSSPYLDDLADISFHPSIYYSDMPDSTYDEAWMSGRVGITNLLRTALEELQLRLEATTGQKSTSETPPQSLENMKSNQVFVVHGHDEEMKITVARVLEKLGLEPIILHEQADKGRTVIEKFVGHADVPFAVVLFSPDDLAYQKNSNPESARPRARQNVVLELGFFLGKLGRESVLVLHRQAEKFELPSDYAGVLFKPFDDHGAWRFELVKELNANGFAVDANRLLK